MLPVVGPERNFAVPENAGTKTSVNVDSLLHSLHVVDGNVVDSTDKLVVVAHKDVGFAWLEYATCSVGKGKYKLLNPVYLPLHLTYDSL